MKQNKKSYNMYTLLIRNLWFEQQQQKVTDRDEMIMNDPRFYIYYRRLFLVGRLKI